MAKVLLRGLEGVLGAGESADREFLTKSGKKSCEFKHFNKLDSYFVRAGEKFIKRGSQLKN